MGLGAVLVLMGTISGVLGWDQFQRRDAIRTWPSVEGTITGCGLVPFRRSGQSQDEQHLVTDLAWEVKGQPHRVTYTEYAGWVSSGSSPPLPYTAGQKVTVYYDPSDPQDATMSNVGTVSLVPFLIAGLCGLVSLPFWFFGIRMARRAKAQRVPV